MNSNAIILIDVMVLYTPRARTAVGSVAAMNAKIDLAIQQSNQAFVNSGVHQRFNLVYKGQVNYDEGAVTDYSTVLIRLRGKTDGHMDNVHALRDTYGADLVSLLVGGEDPGTRGIRYLMVEVSVDFEDRAFSVTRQDFATEIYTFAHETGHNMGSHHDTFVAGSEPTAYPYSHGYTFIGWRTIMAYPNACLGEQFCPRVLYYSSPGINLDL